MQRIFFLIIITVYSCIGFCQDTLNVIDIHGLKQGFWRKQDSVGHVIYEGRFRDGVPTGEFRYYYSTGKIKTISMVSGNGKKAVTTSYFTNGRKMAAGNYLNEKKDSTWQFYSESNGTIVSEEQYSAGQINGISQVFYPEGGLSEIHYYKKNIRDGRWEQYYLDGKIKLRGSYKAGEKQGNFQTWYNSGQLMITGQYNGGHQDGTWTYYDEKGGISKKEIYAEGSLVKVEEPAKK
jgi:antitoxin component YwqK of YwqJK toxin-antitoxin module